MVVDYCKKCKDDTIHRISFVNGVETWCCIICGQIGNPVKTCPVGWYYMEVS